MPVPLPLYQKIHNKFCIRYGGLCPSYVIQLLYLREAIEKELPGIEIFIACNLKHLKDYFTTDNLIVEPIDAKKQFGYVYELKCNSIDHPVQKLLEESNLQLKHLKFPHIKESTKKCVISPKAFLPTKSLTNLQIESVKKLAVSKGYDPIIGTTVQNAGWVIAPENEALFMAAINGIKTTLVPTGFGTYFYKRIFPSGEIFDE